MSKQTSKAFTPACATIWLKALAGEGLTDEAAKALIYAHEPGVVDNTACRDFSGLDTLQASSLLLRLRDRGCLKSSGSNGDGRSAPASRQKHKKCHSTPV